MEELVHEFIRLLLFRCVKLCLLQLLLNLSFIVKNSAINRTHFKFHHIASKCPSFIRKHKFNLAHFLNKIRVSAKCIALRLLIIHKHIMLDQISLSQLNDFKYHIERDRNQVRICNPECQHSNGECVKSRLSVFIQVEVNVTIVCLPNH